MDPGGHNYIACVFQISRYFSWFRVVASISSKNNKGNKGLIPIILIFKEIYTIVRKAKG